MAKQRVVGFYESTANRILNRLGVNSEGEIGGRGRRGGSPGRVKYFRLQEDAATTRIPIYAFEVFDDGSLGTEYVEVYSRFNWLLVAKVDQNLMAIWNGEKSRWDYVPGHCIVFNNRTTKTQQSIPHTRRLADLRKTPQTNSLR